MSVENGIIKEPINVKDPYYCMGIGSYNGGFDVGYACSNNHGMINPWSKYKPVRFNLANTDGSENWWKAQDGNCGFKIKQTPSYQDIPLLMDGVMNGWSYEAPIQGSNWLRLTDFSEYNKNAPPFIDNFSPPESVTVNQDFSVTCMFSRSGSNLIGIDDLDTIKESYFGTYITQDNGSRYVRVTNPKKIKEGGIDATILKNNLAVGRWTAYPFISENPIELMGNDVANSYYTLPNLSPKKIDVVTTFLTVTLSAKDMQDGSILWSAKIQGPGTFANNYVRFRYGNKNFNDAMLGGEVQNEVQYISHPHSEDITTLSGREYNCYDILNSQFGAKMFLSLQSGNQIFETMVMKIML